MLNVLIIDDNKEDTQHLKKLCSKYFHKHNIDYHISSNSEFKDDLNTFSKIDILFIDVKVGEENGIEFSKEIRKRFPELTIIVTSKYSQYLIDGYSIDAKRYFLKPIDETIFNAEMENVLDTTFQKHMGFYDPKIAPYKIHYDKILYVEFVNRVTVLHFLNGTQIKTRYPLKHWVEKLTEYGFAQPYKCYIVNLKYISGISKDERDLFLSNNEKIPLSKFYKKTFIDNYYKSLFKTL